MHSFTQITSRIELRGIVPSNQIKVTFIIILFYPSAWFVFDFFLFHIEIEGKCGWIIGGEGGGGGKGYVGGPPLKLLGGPSPPPLFHIEIEGKCGWNIGGRGGGEGAKGMLVALLSNYWVGLPPPPPPPPPLFF